MKKSSKIRLTAIVLALILLLPLAACGKGDTAQPDASSAPAATEDIRITPTEASSVKTVLYETPDFSLYIPEGWTVEAGGTNIMHSIHVYDPKNPVNQMFVLLKADALLHSQAGKDAWQYNADMGNTGAAVMAAAPVLSDPSTEGFFNIFSEYADFAERVESSYAGYRFPRFDNFAVTDRFAQKSPFLSSALGEALLRANFSQDGKDGEGLFSASVVDFGSFAIASGFNGYQLTQADGGAYMAYNIIAVTAERDTFIEWESILTGCMKTLEYSDSFVSAAKAASDEQLAQAMEFSRNASAAADAMMAAWESRSLSQDIMSQKQSDATLGFDRLYDTETGKIYRADLGWYDGYTGDRLQMVGSDELYAEPISGYIYK